MKKLEKMLALTLHLKKKKKVIVRTKGQEMYLENPREGIKNHGLSNNGMFLLCLDCIMYEKRHSYTIKVFLLPTISTFYSLL